MEYTFDRIAAAADGVLEGSFRPDSAVRNDQITTDSREVGPGSMFIALKGDKFDGHEFLVQAAGKGAVLVCAEKSWKGAVPSGIPVLRVESTLSAFQKIAAMHRNSFPDLKAAALTGSSGKTSTKEMLRAIFNRAFGAEHVLATEGNTNNQIGVPKNLLRLTSGHKICVIEMGTNHFGEITPLAESVAPDASMIVSIGHCHLESFGTLEGVAKEKSTIFRFTKPGGTAVLPRNAAGLDIMKKAADGKTVVLFGPGEGSAVESEYLSGTMDGTVFRLKDNRTGKSVRVEWGLVGRHQAANAAGAAALALSFGIPLETIAEGLKNCVLPGMRMKRSERFGACWINDAYNANPDSMSVMLQWLSEFCDSRKLLLVLGDMLELGPDSVALHKNMLAYALDKFPGAAILAVGPQMTAAAKEIGARKNLTTFPDSKACAAEVRKFVPQGGIVFLKASRGTKLELLEQ